MTRSAWTLVVLLALLAGAAGVIAVRAEGERPEISGPTELALGRAPREIAFVLRDDRSGLRSARISVTHAKGETVLLKRYFTGDLLAGKGPGSERLEVTLDPEALGLVEGDAVLVVEARDWSWRETLGGNSLLARIPLSVDLHAPRVSVRSGLTYVRRGGAAAVLYRVSEEPSSDGVQVGERLYPGIAWPAGCPGEASGCRLALFAVDVDDPADAAVRVVAEDAAGNGASARWDVRIQERVTPKAPIGLSERFLENKVRDLAAAWSLDDSDLVAAFREINEGRRAQDEARIQELVASTTPEPLWSGAFHQLPNSKVTSLFAERRVYSVKKRAVSQATHYGYDLASTAAAPVTASNSGRVLFAGDLGIYGDTVLVDHGLGIVSLYGHLSSIDVAVGDGVERDGVLGRTGATGLAGGDHLHFAILVSGTYVDPREWWDARWVREHVQARMTP